MVIRDKVFSEVSVFSVLKRNIEQSCSNHFFARIIM